MKKTRTSDIETLISATVTGIVSDETALYITARSLMGKYRQYVITLDSEDKLTVMAISDGTDHEEKK